MGNIVSISSPSDGCIPAGDAVSCRVSLSEHCRRDLDGRVSVMVSTVRVRISVVFQCPRCGYVGVSDRDKIIMEMCCKVAFLFLLIKRMLWLSVIFDPFSNV